LIPEEKIMVDIYGRLRQDHAWQRELADLILETDAADSDRPKLFEKFRQIVEAHMVAEEQSFFSVALCLPNCLLLARRGIFGHQKIFDQLRDLEKIDIASEDWLPAFKRVRNNLERYSADEEEFLFPAARQHLRYVNARQLASSYEGLMSRTKFKSSLRWPGNQTDIFCSGQSQTV
jgi:hypothetical protein